MNTNKFYEFFKPELVAERVHIIGCGAVGSLLADTLARMGLTKITLYDFDTVDEHNIANQLYVDSDIGKLKVDALSERMRAINPQIGAQLKLQPQGYVSQPLSGYVFLCVDSIDLRKKIVSEYQYNPFIKAMFDFRMRLTDAQHIAALWMDRQKVDSMLKSMQFSAEEAMAETPVSACNLPLSVIPTVWMIVSVGVTNFLHIVKGEDYHHYIKVDSFRPSVDAC